MKESNPRLPLVESLPLAELSPELIHAGLVLSGTVWKSDSSPEQGVARYLEQARKEAGLAFPMMWHVVREGDTVVAMACSFRRVIATSTGESFPILALAGVCTHPDHRQRKLGSAVVQAAWSRLNREIPICFFQTGVPPFYEKMGARLVMNRIFDSRGTKGFWDPHAMIYPGDASWPVEAIDLLGPGW